jgi:catechol 2,3-dioxygenase-like lactoylglutathione lyase family enzyme
MLTEMHTILPAADLARARSYYHDKLGMDPAQTYDGMLIYSGGGSFFELYETENAGTAQNTQMGWMTDDLEAEMQQLRDHGVVFEEYDVPGMKTENGMLTSEGMKNAWFRDSEGNFICLTQRTE